MDDIWNQMNEPQSKRQRGSSLQQQPLKKFEGNGKGRDVFVAETETEYVHNTDKSINDTAQDDKPDDIVSTNGASDIGNDNSHNNIGQSHCNSKSVLPERKAKIKYVRPVSKFSQIEAEVERVFGSKKKLNMVEKSKLQWDEYIKKEGIEDKLKHYNKDGYVEKTEFLARSNERQYEAFRSLSKK
ncbi:SWR1-complex protein 5 [Zancudomyces culisetae]|uniref:SWR1-complex protein 5 n=1 Tax=Zancudomyces culisetae TaxID=1213189 RepID=A0A1R1PRL6_ZANCU|nr:SWR1-complex protein 5 [Zancudomyces culisetae]|eukprot:OMH83591.1 SWR1-complex protein 5 [Zancudomyces culisetae]